MSITKIKKNIITNVNTIYLSQNLGNFIFFIEKITDWCPDYIKVAFLLQLLYDSFLSS